MSVFTHASNKTYAGLTLALCFETLGDLENPELTENEAKLLGIAGEIGAQECGERASSDMMTKIFNEFQAWWRQDAIQPSDVVETLIAASGTLKAHWKTGTDGHLRFLQAILVLGVADGELSEAERQLPGMIAGLMGISQATFSQALKDFQSLTA